MQFGKFELPLLETETDADILDIPQTRLGEPILDHDNRDNRPECFDLNPSSLWKYLHRSNGPHLIILPSLLRGKLVVGFR
jgi:hypothetical protein